MFRSSLPCVLSLLLLLLPCTLVAQDGDGDGTETRFTSSNGNTVTFHVPDHREVYEQQVELFRRIRALEIAILDLYRATRHSSQVGRGHTKLDLELSRLTAGEGLVDLTMPGDTRFHTSFAYEEPNDHLFVTGGDDASKLETLRNEIERRLSDARNQAVALDEVYRSVVRITGMDLPTGEAVDALMNDLQARYPNLGQILDASPVIRTFQVLLNQYDEMVELLTRLNLYGMWIRRHSIANENGDHGRSLLVAGFDGFQIVPMPPIHLVARLGLTTQSVVVQDGNAVGMQTTELADLVLTPQEIFGLDVDWIRSFVAERGGRDGCPETWNLVAADGMIALLDHEIDGIVASRDGTKDDGRTDNMHDDGSAFRRAVISCGDFLVNWVTLTSKMNRLRWLTLFPVYDLSTVADLRLENWIATHVADMESRYVRYFDDDRRVRWDEATGFLGFGGLRGVHWASYLSNMTDEKAEDWYFLADDFTQIITGVAVEVQ